jgi:predicted nucleic-acid-binding Zn-ribbon protein
MHGVTMKSMRGKWLNSSVFQWYHPASMSQEPKAMRLAPVDVKKVVDHLNKFAKTTCPVCHHDEWTVSDILFALPEYEYRPPWSQMSTLSSMANVGTPSTTFDLESENPRVFPVVPVTCVTCGYVFLFSGIKLGLVYGIG